MSSAQKSELQQLLQAWQPPAGADGFEGLVAVALAQVSGLPIRLARSGSQFGRDGLSTPGDFVIAFEAKRYGDRPPTLQELTTKAALATHDLGDGLDIWACAVTTDIGDRAGDVREILDRAGITLLMIDWPTGGLSPLAALLAGARPQVVAWADNLGRNAEARQLDRLLAAVETEAGYPAALARIMAEVTAAIAGQAALARVNWDWAHDVLADPALARRAFGQYIVPAATTRPVIARPRWRANLAAAVHAAGEGLTVILGGEGSGKSWLAADWWLQQHDVPILLLAAGPLHAAINSEASGADMVAALLSAQHGEPTVRWLRRLTRWQRSDNARIRFAIVLDGLNERGAGKKWATAIDKLVPVIAALGGVLIVTCRPHYWRANVANRLLLPVHEVEIDDFDGDELKAFFLAHGEDLDQLPLDLRPLLANPRIAALAVSLIPRLPSANVLSRDRLLLEYWRSRIAERGDQVALNDDAFRDLLAEHALRFRATGSARFGVSALRDLSEAVVADRRDYDDDLAEIGEGRFFAPAANRRLMNPGVLATALGLLLHRELVDADLPDDGAAAAVIESALEPVQGFDETANAVAACIALAIGEQPLLAHVLAALVGAWFGIQNRDADACRSLAVSARHAPAAFLDAYDCIDDHSDKRALLELLFEVRDAPGVWEVFAPRLARWLGSWTSEAERYGHDADAVARQAERTGQIAAKRRTLLPAELALFERVTTSHVEEPGLANAAVQLAMGKPLAGLADAIVGFAFVGALKGHAGNWHSLFCWLLRSNAVDFRETHAAVLSIIAPLCEDGASPAAKQAAAITLESLGRREDAAEARELWPRTQGQGWRSVERLCDVDPLDPAANTPINLENARAVAQSLDISQVWTSMSQTGEDHHLDEIESALARFEPERLAGLLRAIVRTAPERRGMAIRQLSWHLPELGPLFETLDRAALQAAVDGLVADGVEVEPDDRWWVLAMVVEALLAPLTLEARVALIESLPESFKLYERLNHAPVVASAEEIERVLVDVEHAEPQAIARSLHMLGAGAPSLTPISRGLVVSWLDHADMTVATLAADIVRRGGDDELDLFALASGALEAREGDEYLDAHRSAAFASALVRQKRRDLVAHVPLVELGWVAGHMGGETLALYRHAIDAALAALLRPLATPLPDTLELRVESDDEGRSRRINFDIREVEGNDPFAAFQAATEDRDGRRWESERAKASAELRNFVGGVTREGAGALVQSNWLHGLDEAVADDVEHARGWARQMLSASASGCDRIQALASALAAALARHDPELATALFGRVVRANAVVDTLIGRAKVPLRLHALYRARSHPALDEVRTNLLVFAVNDAEIEAMVTAAANQRADVVLDGIVDTLLASPIPARQALALTITGFRPTTSATQALLDQDYGPGWLGTVAGHAREPARRARWFEHWRDEALAATTGIGFWRAAVLSARCVDRRGLVDRLDLHEGSAAWMYQGSWLEQLRKGADKRTKKRSDRLYGDKRPMR